MKKPVFVSIGLLAAVVTVNNSYADEKKSSTLDDELKRELVRVLNRAYKTSFEEAVQNSLSQIEKLIEDGADPKTMTDKLFLTPISLALLAGNANLITFLINKGIDLRAQVPYPGEHKRRDVPPLMVAMQQKDPDIIKLLLDHGATVSVDGEQGEQQHTVLDEFLTEFAPQVDISISYPIYKLLTERGATATFKKTEDEYLAKTSQKSKFQEWLETIFY